MKNFLSKSLEEWYAVHQRELPWRGTKDPYAVWISEIILQQTRVAQGTDYYNRFLKRFPTLYDVAEASEEEVLRLWQGLGYYSRGRYLHAAARQMAEMGGFPKDYESVRSLKGVGDYTAAAICSIAYNQPYAVVDGNVYRVLSRIFGIDIPIDSTTGKHHFAQLAQELLDTKNPGLYNQAIMDFGALQCVPVNPDCSRCPLQEKCVASAEGSVGQLPKKEHRTKVTPRYFHYIMISTPDEMLLHQRTANDIWKSLYELPLIEADHALSADELTRHPLFREWTGLLPSDRHLKPVCQQIKHVLSHRIIYTDFYCLSASEWAGKGIPSGLFRIHKDELPNYSVSRLVSLLLEKI